MMRPPRSARAVTAAAGGAGLPMGAAPGAGLCALPGVRRPTIVTPACCMMQANTSAAQVVFSLTRTTIGILRYELPDE